MQQTVLNANYKVECHSYFQGIPSETKFVDSRWSPDPQWPRVDGDQTKDLKIELNIILVNPILQSTIIGQHWYANCMTVLLSCMQLTITLSKNENEIFSLHTKSGDLPIQESGENVEASSEL